MALTVQNLRAVGTGVEPASLLPGQIAFNITDKVIYVGDGSNFKTAFDGTQTPGVPGAGWYAMPMDFSSLGDYYVANPGYWGDVPTDQQILTWSTALNHPIWTSGGGGGGGNQVYVVTNAAVAAAPGATTSAKITAAIGVASPDEGDVTIVTGIPDDVYEGLYFFTTEWVKGAAYAYPSATEVIYDNTVTGLTPTVQGAIDDLSAGLTATTAIANTANSTANSALSIANAALPKAGGTMTGAIVAQNINVQNGYSLQFNGGVSGSVNAISDSISLTSSTTAASSSAVRSAYQLAQAALPRAGGTMTGVITFAAGQVFPISGIQIASTSQLGVVQIGTNINVTAGGVISVNTGTTSTPGIVQLVNDTITNDATQALTAAMGYDLQVQINGLSVATNVDLGGSLDCVTGVVDSVTAAGVAAGLVLGSPLPSPAIGNIDVYLIVTTGAASYTPPGGGGTYAPENGDWFLSNGTIWQYLGVGARPSYASPTVAGIIQLAYPSDVQAGLNNTLAVTPAGLQSKVSDSTSLISSTTIASSTAVNSAYDLANAAVPQTGGTMTGSLTFLGAGTGVQFSNGSIVQAISDSVATTSSVTAASSTAVKSAYDLGFAALPKAGGTMTGAITFVAGQTFPISGIQDATTGQKGVVQVGTNIQVSSGTISVNTATTSQLGLVQVGSNIDVAAGTISVKSASTTQSGIVQLNDTVTSTSTTQALTANQGYNLQQQINALATSNNLTFAGTIDGSTGLMATVTVEGAGVGFAVGSALPAPSATIDEYFVIVSVAGTMTPTGGTSTVVYVGDWWLASPTSWTYIAAGFQPPYASTTTPGLVRLSTSAETQAGTDSTEAVTPASLQSKVSDSIATTSGTTIASSTAVKTAYDLANAAVPRACYTALGALAAGTGSSAVGTLSVGTNGQFLSVNTACGTGLEWCTLSLACVPCSAYTGKGAILAGTGTSTFTALPVGTNGQVLVPNSSCTTGLEWITVGALCLNGYTCGASPFNTALGTFAGDSITSGTSNTLIGFNAGTALTSGVNNVAIGCGALDATSAGGNNVAIGPNALGSSTTGVNNLAIGFDALAYGNAGNGNLALGISAGANVSSGINNVFIAQGSGDAITTGACNIVIGFNAMGAATTTTEAIAIGVNAGCVGITGAQSVLVGTAAGQTSTGVGATHIGYAAGCSNASAGCTTYFGFVSGRNATGLSNTYVGALTGCAASNTSACGTLLGFCAGSALTTGNANNFIGFQAGRFVTTGGFNVALGTAAFQTATSAANNVAIGCGALAGLTTTCGNVAIGHRAMINASTAANNVVIGCNAGEQISTGTCNTVVGVLAGDAMSSATNNTLVGANAGGAITLGGTNILIGANAGSGITTGFNNTIIGDVAGSAAITGNLILAAGTTIKLQVNENGAVGVGSTPSYGTAGQVLQSAGTAAAPTWTTPVWQPLTTLTTTSTTATTLLSVPVASTRAVFIDISVSDATGGNYHTDSYQVVTDGTVTDDQQIAGARIGTNPYTLTSAVVGANLVISVTSASANSTKYVGSYQAITV